MINWSVFAGQYVLLAKDSELRDPLELLQHLRTESAVAFLLKVFQCSFQTIFPISSFKRATELREFS